MTNDAKREQGAGSGGDEGNEVEVRARAGRARAAAAPPRSGLAGALAGHWRALLIVAYQLVVLLFLLAELGVPWLAGIRATNQVLLLVALLFVPFVVLATGSVIDSVTFRYGRNTVKLLLENVETVSHQVEESREEITELRQRVGGSLAGKVGDSEAVLFSVLAGDDPKAAARLAAGVVTIGSKTFAASQALAGFLAEWLERRVPAVRTGVVLAPNGSTLQNWADLRRGAIDLYVEYTGTAAGFLGIEHRDADGALRDPAAIVAELDGRTAALGIEWAGVLGATDDYRIVVRREDAQARGWKCFSDLAAYAGELTFGTPSEGVHRHDGPEQLQEHYGCRFRRLSLVAYDAAYASLREKRVDVILGWESHVELRRVADFAVLEDDRRFFPAYHAVPAVRRAALAAIPALRDALHALRGRISTADVTALTDKIALKGGAASVSVELGRAFARERLAGERGPAG